MEIDEATEYLQHATNGFRGVGFNDFIPHVFWAVSVGVVMYFYFRVAYCVL